MSSNCCPVLPESLRHFEQTARSVASFESESKCLEMFAQLFFLSTLYLSYYSGVNAKNPSYYTSGCIATFVAIFAIDIYIHLHRKRVVQAIVDCVMNQAFGLLLENSNRSLSCDILCLSILLPDSHMAQMSQEQQENLQANDAVYSRVYAQAYVLICLSVFIAYGIGNKQILHPEGVVLLFITFSIVVLSYRMVFFSAALREVNQVFAGLLNE